MKKSIVAYSGYCKHSGFHQFCHATWETPSAYVTCGCECHQGRGPEMVLPSTPPLLPGRPMVPKGGRVIVPKS